MAKAPPSFDFFYNDWCAGTKHLDLVEKACYLELLVYQWQNGHIPVEPVQRMNLCGVSDLGAWERVWRHIKDKFEPVENDHGETVLANLRMADDRVRSIERWRKLRENGKKGGRPRSKPNGYPNGSCEKTIWEGGRRKEEGLNKDKNSQTKFKPPTASEVLEYSNEKGLEIDPDAFCDFYASKGWKVGSAAMRDWRAAARGWARRQKASKEKNVIPEDF